MNIGYARVSTIDQNLDLQLDTLKKIDCKKIFTDKVSGVKEERKGLQEALEYAREGDCLVVYKLDRLARSLKQLVKLINILAEKKVAFRSLNENIDTSSTSGKLVFHIFASIAEFERDIIRDRTKAGLAAARARGRQGGTSWVECDNNQLTGNNSIKRPNNCYVEGLSDQKKKSFVDNLAKKASCCMSYN